MDRRCIYSNRMRWLATRNPMRLSRTELEVRDVSSGAGRGRRGDGGVALPRWQTSYRTYRDCIGEQTSGRCATPRAPGRSNHITPGLTLAPAPHTSFDCASLWRRPGPCMILVRVRLISGRLNLTRRRRFAREIKTGSGPEGAIDP